MHHGFAGEHAVRLIQSVGSGLFARPAALVSTRGSHDEIRNRHHCTQDCEHLKNLVDHHHEICHGRTMNAPVSSKRTDAHIVAGLLTRLLETGITADEYQQLANAADRLAANDAMVPEFVVSSDLLERLGYAVHRSERCTVAEMFLYVGLGFAAAYASSVVSQHQSDKAAPHHAALSFKGRWTDVGEAKTADAVEMGLHDIRRVGSCYQRSLSSS
jgi:hypothetical protein